MWAGWEPDRYYLRIGARTTSYFGHGDWIFAWRKRLEAKECMETIAKAGTSVIVTRFYKGFGPELEAKEWPSLKRFISNAHEAELKVWGYLQGQSLFGEFLFNERPEARNWVAHTFEGKPVLWAGAYNRFAPCLANPDYREMVEELVEKGLCDLGFDGIHADNNYYQHCYCPRCKELFRAWLDHRGDLEKRTGLPFTKYVEPPPLHLNAGLIPDPLAHLWMEFGVQQRLAFMAALRQKVHTLKPDAQFTGNPAFLKSFPSRLSHAVDPRLEAQVCDFICIENGNQPRVQNGKIYTQADKQLFAEAAGLKTWVTSWRPGEKGSSPPAQGSLWAGLAEEFSFSHSLLGNNWALRPSGNGGQFLFEAMPEQWRAFSQANEFFQKLEVLLGADSRTQWADTVLYVDTRSLAVAPGSDAPAVQTFLAHAIRKNIPLKILLQGQRVPAETRTVIIFQQRCLEEAELARLTSFVREKNRQLWIIGACGIYDEWSVQRSEGSLLAWTSLPNVETICITPTEWTPQSAPSASYFSGQAAETIKEADEIFRRLLARQRVRIHAPEGILSNIERLDENRLIVHLRDLREVPGGSVEIEVCASVSRAQTSLVYSPSWNGARSVPAIWQNSTQTVSLSSFGHYAGIIVCLSAPA